MTVGQFYDTIVFVPYTDDRHIRGFYYKATLSEDNNSSHYILLYCVGVHGYQEPKRRWMLLDITENHGSEGRGDNETVINALEAYDSMQSILLYVGDVYNASTRFQDEPRTGKYIP